MIVATVTAGAVCIIAPWCVCITIYATTPTRTAPAGTAGATSALAWVASCHRLRLWLSTFCVYLQSQAFALVGYGSHYFAVHHHVTILDLNQGWAGIYLC